MRGGLVALQQAAAIGVEIVLEGPDRPAIDEPQAVGDQLDKVPIVADQHDRPRILGQCRDQGFAGFHVEVIGRLVENQQPRRVIGHQRQVEAGSLAARKLADRYEGLVLAEAKPAEPGPNRLGRAVRHKRGKMVKGRFRGAHLLDLMLCEEPAGELWRADHLPGKRLEAAGEKAREGGLAVAIGAEQRDAVVGVEP
jgi:hypothetical protein